MSALVDRTAERAHLASCLSVQSWAGESGLMPHEMSSPQRQRILAAVLACAARGEQVDTVSVRAELHRMGEGDRCTEELLEVSNALCVPSAFTATRLRTLAKARSRRDAALKAASLYEAGRIEDAEAELREATGDEPEGEGRTLSMRDLVTRGVEIAHERTLAVEAGRPTSITTGIRALDVALGDDPAGVVLGGWEPGDFVVLGGDTNAGKSSLAMAMAYRAARQGVRVGIVQVEDPEARVGLRALSMATQIPQHTLRSGRMSMNCWDRVARASTAMAELPMWFEFRIAGTLPEIGSAIRRLVRGKGCQVVVLDYLQAVQVDEEPRLAVRDVVSECKRAASSGMDVPAVVVGLSQFRKRQDETERPSRSDLFESAYIAQKAEHIVLCWKDSSGALRCVLDKTKDGRTGAQWAMHRDPDTGQLVSEDEVEEGMP